MKKRRNTESTQSKRLIRERREKKEESGGGRRAERGHRTADRCKRTKLNKTVQNRNEGAALFNQKLLILIVGRCVSSF